MPNYNQLPGTLDLALVAGDEFTFTATFDQNLTGYTLSASVFNTADDTVLATPTLSTTSGTTSTVTLTMSETQTAAIYTAASPINGVPTARVRWYLRWSSPSGYTRTVLSGLAKVARP